MQPAVLALGFVCLATAACGEFATVKKCRAVAARVNPGLESIEKTLDGKRGTETYRAVSRKYAELAKELEAFDAGAGASELDQSVAEYAGTLREAALRTEEYAAAVDAGNKASATLAQRELEREAKRQKSVVKRLREDCQGR